MKLSTMAVAAALTLGVSGVAMAQPVCGPGYRLVNGICEARAPGGFSNPASGAVNGEERGAQRGAAVAGPVGAVVGGAVGVATGTLQGTANMLSGGSTPPGCGPGYVYYNGGCYPRR